MILLLALSSVLLAFQQGAQSDMEQRLRVDYVWLDVIAVDRNGEPVTDLGPADFVVTENKRPIELESVEAIDLREGLDEGSSVAVAPQPDLRFVVTLDLRQAGSFEARQTLNELERFLTNLPQVPGIEYTAYSMEHGSVFDGFTADPLRVWRALDALEPSVQENIQAAAPSDDGVSGPLDVEQLLPHVNSCRIEEGTDDRPARHADIELCLSEILDGYIAGRETRTERRIIELGNLVYGYGDGSIAHRFLLVSPGLSLQPGVEAVRLARDLLDTGPTDFYPQDATGSPLSSRASSKPTLAKPRSFELEMRHLVHAGIRNRATFFTFEPPKEPPESQPRESKTDPGVERAFRKAYQSEREALAKGLGELADRSGGQYGADAVAVGMRDAVELSRFLYTLGYPAPPGERGQFRNVEVKCRRPNVRLLYPSGYFVR
jgi:hypothetical protein